MTRKAFGLTFNQCAILLFLAVLGVGYLLPSKDEEPIATQSLDEPPQEEVVEPSPEKAEEPIATQSLEPPQEEVVKPSPQTALDYAGMEDKHAEYIVALNRNLVKYNVSASIVPDGKKLAAGWQLCQSLDKGQTLKQYLLERFDSSQMTEEERAGAFIVAESTAPAAILVYCPQHADEL